MIIHKNTMIKKMRRIVFAILLMCSMPAFAQLTQGKYKIISVKGFMNEKTVYENFFEDNTAIIRVTPKLVNIVISGYSALTYAIENPKIVDNSYVYKAREIQSGSEATLVSQRTDGFPQIDGGMLMINRSDNYADIFVISKED